MDDSLVVSEIVDRLSGIWSEFGLNPCMGKAWGTLYFSGAMTQDELKKIMGCSLSAVSQALSNLERLGMVSGSSRSGRKHLYSAESDLGKISRAKVDSILRFCLDPICSLLSSREKEVKSKEIRHKVAEMRKMYCKIGMFLRAVSKVPS